VDCIKEYYLPKIVHEKNKSTKYDENTENSLIEMLNTITRVYDEKRKKYLLNN